MLGPSGFLEENGHDQIEAVERRLERAIEAGDSLDARLILLALHAGIAQASVIERYGLEGDGKMDVQMDVSREGFAGRLDVIEGPTGRRLRSDEEKARIVAASLVPGVRVADVARRHGATRWQVYEWRRRVRNGRLVLPESMISAPAFAALVVEEPPPLVHGKKTEIEIVVGEVVIRTGRDVDEGHLWRVIRAVRAAG